MTLPQSSIDPAFRIYLSLVQYPILQKRIRAQMRYEMFKRGIISAEDFNSQVRTLAVESQRREGLIDPFAEEPEDVWLARLEYIRNYLTDFHFANDLSFELFEEITRSVLEERGALQDEWETNWNAELAPQEILVEQAIRISRLPEEERKAFEASLEEIKVVLIRNMISDQLAYIKVAKKWFTLEDLLDIRERKIGSGKVGGKAAGMLLAKSILSAVADDDIRESIRIPESYFLGADVMYAFMAHNNLMRWSDQKYKSEDEIRANYPQILEDYLRGVFPADIRDELQYILHDIGNKPLIVRSSSLLEDNFGTSFAGKYESHFCPNQGTPEENFREFERAIIKVYASALSPDPLLYRRSKDLQDYDERIAVLIQMVQGEQMGGYYLPHAAGVGFSQNLYRWSPQIERDAGFVRLVWGLGTRAVDRVGDDFPRLVALSHPLLHSHSEPQSLQRYSQKKVDLIDLKANQFRTLPVQKVLHSRYPILRYIAQLYYDGYLAPLRSSLKVEPEDLVINMDEMLQRTPFADRMRRMLGLLEKHYHAPVDMEFAVQFVNLGSRTPDVEISILQCRPQSLLQETEVTIPKALKKENLVFTTSQVLPHGQVDEIDSVIFVTPEGYHQLQTSQERTALVRAIGQLNKRLMGKTFICVGPGRWGTSTPDLGVGVGYSDIYYSSALVELSGKGVGLAPEPSFGTHFFQDLLESSIYPLAIDLDDGNSYFNRQFFYETRNRLLEYLPDAGFLTDVLRLIRVKDFRKGWHIKLVIDGEAGKAAAFLQEETE
ncbi:MAG: PEP/pyruvate-binding domain-containing protein [Anaerolineales bacterium]|nr:PEP/pyruvate-binding domain-containing protein [Anaerolineales bacterium]